MASKTSRGVRGSAFAIPAAIALFAGAAVSITSAATPPAPSEDAIRFADSLSQAFRGAAAAISPAVVNISVVQKASPSLGAGPGGNPNAPQIPDEFRRFFRFGPNGGDPFGQPGAAPERRGQGTGVIIREDGYILTNNHVVDGADEITVSLDDGTEYTASLVGADPDSDLAVIRIQASGLYAARVGDSDSLQPGDWVVAVGNPFGLDHTVTAGVVSATGRGDMGLNTFEDFIQTDAAINPGNSGGPMVNLHGEVIGINSAIRSASGGNNGVGFAIPANLAMHVADSLIEDGKVERGWLGVSIQQLTPDLASSLGVKNARGALVADVVADAPAAKAGLESGDVIVGVNNEPVDSPRTLMNTIAQHEPGDRVTLAVERDGSSKTFDVTLGERDGAATLAGAAPGGGPEAGSLGLSVQPLTADLAGQLGVDATEGLLVTEVRPESAAAEAGLRPEDVILEAARHPVRTPAELADAAKGAKDGLLLKINRAGHTLYIVVKSGS